MGSNDTAAFADLFKDQAAVQPQVSEQQEPQGFGEQMQAAWLAMNSVIAQMEQTSKDVVELQRAALINYVPEHDMSWRTKAMFDDHDASEMRREFANHLSNQLVWTAAKEFAPSGGRLEIYKSELPPELFYDDEAPERFDLAALWQHLEKNYGGDAGDRQAKAQAVEAFKSGFRLGREDAVQIKGGYTVLNLSVYIDSFDKKYGRTRLSYSAAESARQALDAMRQILWFIGLYGAAHDLRGFMAELLDRHVDLPLRKAHVLDEGKIKITTFSNKFEVKIATDVADKLQLFIGEYGC